ncbi:MAG: hypothetical protein IJV68_01955 [Clostridia bacterium]|nr:hypothetical protein [Clostridia bacterium]
MKAKSIVSIIGTLVLVVFVLAIGAGVYMHFIGDDILTSDFYVLYNGKEISSNAKGYEMSKDKAVAIYVVDKTSENEETEYTVKVVPNVIKDKDFNIILDGEITSYQSIKDLTEGFDIVYESNSFTIKPLGDITTILNAVYVNADIEDCSEYTYEDMFTLIISNGENTVEIDFTVPSSTNNNNDDNNDGDNTGDITGVKLSVESIIF